MGLATVLLRFGAGFGETVDLVALLAHEALNRVAGGGFFSHLLHLGVALQRKPRIARDRHAVDLAHEVHQRRALQSTMRSPSVMACPFRHAVTTAVKRLAFSAARRCSACARA